MINDYVNCEICEKESMLSNDVCANCWKDLEEEHQHQLKEDLEEYWAMVMRGIESTPRDVGWW